MKKEKYFQVERHFSEGKLHRDNGPAVIYKHTSSGKINRVDYYNYGEYIRSVKFIGNKVSEKLFNSEGIIKIKYRNKPDCKETIFTYKNGNTISEKVLKNGSILSITYKSNGMYHRDNGPAVIIHDDKRGIYYQMYYRDNKLHNDNGPARLVYSYYKGEFELEEQEFYIKGKKIDELNYLINLGLNKNTYKFG